MGYAIVTQSYFAESDLDDHRNHIVYVEDEEKDNDSMNVSGECLCGIELDDVRVSNDMYFESLSEVEDLVLGRHKQGQKEQPSDTELCSACVSRYHHNEG